MAWQAAEEDLAWSNLTRAEVMAVRQAPEDGMFAVRFAAADGCSVEASPNLATSWRATVGSGGTSATNRPTRPASGPTPSSAPGSCR
jgi:hypothetical protein